MSALHLEHSTHRSPSGKEGVRRTKKRDKRLHVDPAPMGNHGGGGVVPAEAVPTPTSRASPVVLHDPEADVPPVDDPPSSHSTHMPSLEAPQPLDGTPPLLAAASVMHPHAHSRHSEPPPLMAPRAPPLTEPLLMVPSVPRRDHRERPCYALSVNLIRTYKHINSKYFAQCRQRGQEGDGAIHNKGYDDEHGNYLVHQGEEIADRYLVQSALGKGSFGVVVKAYDIYRRKEVALKIIKNKRVFTNQALIEINLLNHIRNVATEKDNVVKVLDSFFWYGHTCVVMEKYGMNLFELLKRTAMRGITMYALSRLCNDLLCTLRFLYNEKIVHCDLKPENILLRSVEATKITVIDFGSACPRGCTMYNYIQTRFYRAPEVILGHSYSHGIDMWSLGVILVEMLTGRPLFEGRCELELLNKMEQVLGPLPRHMVDSAHPEKLKRYFTRDEDSGKDAPWKVRAVEGLAPSPPLDQIIKAAEEERQAEAARVAELLASGPQPDMPKRPTESLSAQWVQASHESFLSILRRMLTYDPEQRLTPFEGLEDKFLSFASVYEEEEESEGDDDDDEEEEDEESDEEEESEEHEDDNRDASGIAPYPTASGAYPVTAGGYMQPGAYGHPHAQMHPHYHPHYPHSHALPPHAYRVQHHHHHHHHHHDHHQAPGQQQLAAPILVSSSGAPILVSSSGAPRVAPILTSDPSGGRGAVLAHHPTLAYAVAGGVVAQPIDAHHAHHHPHAHNMPPHAQMLPPHAHPLPPHAHSHGLPQMASKPMLHPQVAHHDPTQQLHSHQIPHHQIPHHQIPHHHHHHHHHQHM
eukprot:TRINITY_DN2217_c0_g2_i1.p1 TRINITY_DN2217_c0_g2~~TRINITY_DN2217_c0_g2_i1.p1  ORF type:complete len:808 (+),score=256.44 TRINITY_DN2217_c0_g2_i1:215-2638(+)